MFRRPFLLLVILAVSPIAASAQVQIGTPPFGSFGGGPDVINLGNLNAHWTIPVLHKAGRGANFNYDLNYDSSIWAPVLSNGTTSWQFSNGWTTSILPVGYLSEKTTINTGPCPGGGRGRYTQSIDIFTYVDGFGTRHPYTAQWGYYSGCGQNITYAGSQTAPDGSGYKLTVTGGTVNQLNDSAGRILNVPVNGTGASTVTDRNGNQISLNLSNVWTDTLGATALTITGGPPPAALNYTYTAPSGTSAVYTMKYSTLLIQTNFGCANISEYGTNGTTTANLVTEIDLPDWNASTNPNAKYVFTYENTPGHSGFVTGRLASVTLPTGGTISYTYTSGNLTGPAVGSNDPIVCADGSAAGLQRYTPDTGTNSWTYARTLVSGSHWQTKVTTPPDPVNQGSVGNATVIDFQKDSAAPGTNNFYETQRVAYQGSSSGTVLQTVTTCYNTNTTNCTTTSVNSPITQRNLTTSIPSAGSATLMAQTIATYNSAGVPTEFDEFAFGSGAVGGLLKQTLITYASLGSITAFRQTVTVKNSAGTILAQTNYNYDETTPVAAPSGTAQLTSAPGSRGNLTSVQRCTNLTSCSNPLQTTMTYDTAGQLQTVKDPLNNQTSFSYTDKFYDDNGSNPPAAHAALSNPTDAYVTTVTLPTTKTLKRGYYFYSGQLAAATDQNGIDTDHPANTSYSHFDSFGRPSSTYGPTLPIAGSPSPGNANPWTLINYTSLNQADTYTDINDTSTTASSSCTVCRHDQVALDGLGRSIHGYLVSDPEGQTKVDTVYDALGRVLSSSHPYRSTSDGTYGIETPAYDALGRTTKVTHQDSTYSQTLYGAAVTGTGVNTTQLCSSSTYGLGFPILAIDEAGKKRELWTDGLGRTIEADEPDSSGNLTSNTCYSYDPLGNLLQIVRSSSPSQTRTYAYDALSRLTSVIIPERANSSGTNCAVTYSYDGNSNLYQRIAPAPNQVTSCTTTVTTTFSFDVLNRLTKIAYGATTPVATPTVQYAYDGNSLAGCATTPPTLTDSNGKGRRTSMCDGSGATSWAHDAMGRIITERRIIMGSSAITQTLSYSYNLDNSIATVTYPSGKTVTYTVSNAQRLTAAKDVANNIQFATAASFAAPGGLNGMITGQISGFGGISETHTYNNSLEYTSTTATSTTGTAMDLTLSYALSGGDNGTVTTITNNVDTLRTQTLTYDPLNRILSAKSAATSAGPDCWGQVFGPDGNAADDAVANLIKINSGTQTQPTCPYGMLSGTVDANNHITTDSTYAYDAPGNMTKDGSGTGWLYAFDAENRLTLATGPSGGPYCYAYDGNGLRVAKKSGTASDCTGGTVVKLYWRSLSGDALAETDGSGSTQNEYVFFAGRRIASRDGSGHIFYYFADQLGSIRTITTGSGSGQTPGQLCYDADFTPYGQEITYTARLQATACPPNYKFTGYERDSETGLDYAFARHYSSRLGRFLSTDPFAGVSGPQSLNAYAYVLNNPMNFMDPSGLWCSGNAGERDTPCNPANSSGPDTSQSWVLGDNFAY